MVLGMRFHDFTAAIGRLAVLPRLVQRGHRSPDLEAARHVRLPRHSAKRQDRRARLFGERGPLHTRLDENECPGGRIPPLPVKLERRPATEDEVKLLVLSRLVVLVDDSLARGPPGPDVGTERRNPEVVPNGTEWAAAVGDLLDLIEVRDLVAHAPIIAGPPALPRPPRIPRREPSRRALARRYINRTRTGA